ncbi:MAG: nickel pincer cofactor biosynthesis protein LarC [Spirochaetes bacterium]|nr:nickel pincer cofactor biosynthesis protein LarC [Brevinematales bacterium]MCL1958724.1 nickel pincer cofactor biosynthesis protein LarC [Spirochaetota bacterium]
MKTLYFECNMGAAGDMLMAVLLELHDNPQDFLKKLNSIGIPDVFISAQPSVKCGITGTHITVTVNGKEEDEHSHEHHHHDHTHDEHDHIHEHTHSKHEHRHSHNNYHDIEHLIGHLNVSDTVKKNALAVYKLIAEAESRAHGVPADKIHFHEVGEMDAIADITGVCMLIEELAPDIILASPVNTGSGHVRCAHGILPVPVPATAYILQNVPMYSDQTQSELCTPTGAALLKHFVKEFRVMPVITVNKIGYGMGKKDFEKANCIRAYIGNTANNAEDITELVCNLDDMTPEAVSFAQQLLFEEGALDVYTTPVCMKKGRMGLSFTCMCRSELKDKMVSLIFKHTTTLGMRENTSRRYTLQREQKEIQTQYGTVRTKTAYGYGVQKSKPEYEDIAAIARKQGISIQDVLKEIQKL